MVHRAQDSRLLLQLLKSDKEYSQALSALLNASQASLAALNAYASSCPPSHAQAMLGVVGAFSAADEAFRNLVGALDAWRVDLKKIKGCEDVVANVLKDREILISKLLKATSKKSTRDSVGPSSGPFNADPSLALMNPTGGSSTTLTSGTGKLGHAQAELQACEAHLATREKELEETRQVAIKNGLERRCKALISCGWTWGERGKQALRALEVFGNDRAANGSNQHGRNEKNDSQLSSVTPSVTPSQSASQIALPVASDESHDISTSAQQILTSSLSPNPANQIQLPPAVPAGPEPEFTLNIGPAHSIDDHGHIHDSIPSSRLVEPARRTEPGVAGDSSDEGPSKTLEVHENHPFAKRQSPPPISTSEIARPSSPPERSRTLRKPADSQRRHPPPSKIAFPQAGTGTLTKPKHSSDLGPRSTFTPYEAPQHSPIKEGFGGTLQRKRTSSLMNGLAGLFRSKKRSSSIERAYPVPTSTGGWHTRTDRNLERRSGNSSSEDELPSTLVRRSRVGNDSSLPADDQKRLSKRGSRSSKSSKKEHDPMKYTVVERPARSPDLIRNASISSKKSGDMSSDGTKQTAVETAANTAFNSGGSTINKRSSLPVPERPSWEARSYGESIMNRLQNDTGTMNISTPNSRPSTLESIAERQRRSEDRVERERIDASHHETSQNFTLPPPKLEVVRAPPSITTVPPLVNSNTSPESPRSSTLKDQSTSGSSGPTSGSAFVRGHARTQSITNVRAPPDTGSSLVSKQSISSRDAPAPLKSALKSPTKQTTSLPALPSILVKRIEAEEPGRTPTATPPTPLGAKEGLKPNGDSLFIPASAIPPSPSGSRSPPPVTASSLVPTPSRLSNIPASNRSSIIDDDDSVYETAGEDGSDSDHEVQPEEQDTPILSPVPMKPPAGVQMESSATPPMERMLFEPKRQSTKDSSAEVSASSTTSASTPSRRKSVRMIIYPTATVSAPEHYNEPVTPVTADPPSSASTIRQTARNDRDRLPSAWETRINTERNAWDDSSEEDEEYGRARRALARAFEPPSNDAEYERGRQRSNRARKP